MKTTLRIAAIATIMQAHNVLAATGLHGADISLAGWLFIGFMTLIVAMQLVPALLMFGSMMSAIFTRTKKVEKLSLKETS